MKIKRRSTPISTIEIVLTCVNGLTVLLLLAGVVRVLAATRHLAGIEAELQNGIHREISEICATYNSTHLLFSKLQDRIQDLESLEKVSKILGVAMSLRLTNVEHISQENQHGY